MKKQYRILIPVLLIAIVLSAFVFAFGTSADAGQASYENEAGEKLTAPLTTAIAEAKDGTTVTLLGDSTLTEAQAVGKNLTVDLGGYTLTSSGANAFSVTESVSFTITGKGSILLSGMLYETASDKAPTVTVKGIDEGISIQHNKTSGDPYIVHNYNGTYLYENIDITTTYSQETSGYLSFLHNDTATTEASVTLKTVEFHAPTTVPKNPGTFILGVCGASSKLTIQNSGLYSAASGIYAGHLTAASHETEIIKIEDSVMSLVSQAQNSKSYGIYLEAAGFGSKGGAVGYVSVTNSLLESAGRVIYQSIDKGTNLTPNVVKSTNSTFRTVATTGTNGDACVTRHVELQLDATSRVSSTRSNKVIFATAWGTVTGQVGTRTDSIEVTQDANGIHFPDTSYGTASGTYTWVYDPIGDADYPYVIALKSSLTNNVVPSYYQGLSFGTIDKIGSGNILYQGGRKTFTDNNGVLYVSSGPTAIQTSTSGGTLLVGNTEGNTYLKYVVTNNRTGSDQATVNGDEIIYGIDPFYIFGGPMDYTANKAYFSDVNTSYKLFDSETKTVHDEVSVNQTRASVVVASIDFGTESFDCGYPEISIKLQTRYAVEATSSGVSYHKINQNSNTEVMTLSRDGNLYPSNITNADIDVMKLNPAGEWNRLTAVIYTDKNVNSGKGIAYYYLNGNYIGTTVASANGSPLAYVQGLRFDISKTNPHKLGASISFDNSSFAVYTDYKYETADASGNVSGEFYPEKYINGAPEKRYIATALSVSGIPVDGTVADALTAAESLGTVAELKNSISREETVNKNGSIKLNGNSFPISAESFGYVNDNGTYTFDEGFAYTVHWYIGEPGNATEMQDDSKYVTETVKLGHTVDHEIIHTTAVNNYETLETVTQLGWGYDETGASASVTPFVPGSEEYELYRTSGVKMYPAISGIPMTFYVKGSDGAVYVGGATALQATDAFASLKSGDTFVMQNDVILGGNTPFLFENDTEDAKIIGIDLGGHTLTKSFEGEFIIVGNNTTLNVYSSVAGGRIVSGISYGESSDPFTSDSAIFAIGDESYIDRTISAENAAALAAKRSSINNAYINLGTVTVGGQTIPGSNMTVTSNVVFEGFVGAENCAFIADGVDIYSPGSKAAFDLYVYDGDAYIKNCIVFAPTANSILNIEGFSANNKHEAANGRDVGFENFLITSYMELDNVYIVNNLAGFGDGKNNNIVDNNGDSSALISETVEKRLKFKNVATTGRLNPSNYGGRTAMEGFVAAEVHDLTAIGNRIGDDMAAGIFNGFMNWQMIDLGIEDKVVTFNIPVYDSISGEIVNYNTYNVASWSANVEGLTNVYTLPEANYIVNYKSELAAVTWEDLGERAPILYEYYVKGSYYANDSVPEPNPTSLDLTAVSLVSDGTWIGAPKRGDKIEDSITVKPGYTAVAKLSGVETNMSLWSDIGVNLYFPLGYLDILTVKIGEDVLAETEVDTDKDGVADSFAVGVRRSVLDVNDGIDFIINVNEMGYEASDTVSVDIVYYVSQVLANAEAAEEDKALMFYLANYASEAVKYFEGSADAELEKLVSDNIALDTLAPDYSGAIAELALSSVFCEATVLLTDTAPAFVFRIKDGFAGSITVSFGDGQREFTVTESGSRILIIGDVKIYDLISNITISAVGKVGEEDVTLSGAYNLDTFAAYHVANAASEFDTKYDSVKCLAIIEALYSYAVTANNYKAINQ